MRILIFDCHKNKIFESEKIRNAFLLADGSLQIDIIEVRKLNFPDIEKYDKIVVSGADSFMSKHLWIRKLKETLQETIDFGKPVLGICYGNEILGGIFGFETIALEKPEIGWINVELTEDGKNDPLFRSLPSSFPVFEHHIKAVLVPGNKQEQILARNESCTQAIKYANNVYGIQFHAEETPESGIEFLRNDPKCLDFSSAIKLKPGNYIEHEIFKNFLNIC